MSIRWDRAGIVEAAIEKIVRRWAGPPLLVALTGCQDVPPIETGPVAAGSGGPAPTAQAIPDDLSRYQPDLSTFGNEFQTAHCAGGYNWDPMPYVQPVAAFDYRSLRLRAPDRAPLVSTAGTACATATDEAKCQSALNIAPVCPTRDCPQYFINTSLGDVVTQFGTRVEVRDFLGPIDTSEEALLLAAFEGYTPGHGPDPCFSATVRETADGYYVYAHRTLDAFQCTAARRQRVLFLISREGDVQQLGSAVSEMTLGGACPGRRPEGLYAPAVDADSEFVAFWARSAQLEAAAVHAFERMAAELRAHAAPPGLIEQVERARRDEQRHTRAMLSVAGRLGAQIPVISVEPHARRSLLAMAIENAAEGCARETWAAVVATHQAARIPDYELAVLLARIAADERRHAALSWQVHAWLDRLLDASEQRLVRAAYAQALAELRREIDVPVAPELTHQLGLPDQATAAALLRDVSSVPWNLGSS